MADPTNANGPLRVAILSDDGFPESGGMARSTQLQISQLAAAGHEVVLLAPKQNLVPPPEATCLGMPYLHLPHGPDYVSSLQASPRLARRIAAEYPVDVVHSQTERGALHLGAAMARALGVPHVHTFHANYVGTHATTTIPSGLLSLTYLPLAGHILRLFSGRAPLASTVRLRDERDSIHAGRDWASLAAIAAHTDAFTSPAPFMVESIEAASGGALAGRGHVVPGGVADVFARAQRARPAGAPTRFLSCSRLSPEKRVGAIIDAFALLDDPDAELCVIGAGTEGELNRLRRRAASVPNVRFLGHYTDSVRIAQEFADADVFVLASYRFDTQGLVLADAAAAGTPILYCDERLTIGTSPDNSLLTGPSPAELAEGMRTLAADPARRARMSQAARAWRPSLSAATMRDRYVQVYRDAIAAGRR